MQTSTTTQSMKTLKPSLDADFLSLVQKRKTKQINGRTARRFKKANRYG